jgi:hypothetical protein
MKNHHKVSQAIYITSLNPMPNAQVCIWPFWSDIDTSLDSDTCATKEGYLFLPGFFPCMMPSMDG